MKEYSLKGDKKEARGWGLFSACAKHSDRNGRLLRGLVSHGQSVECHGTLSFTSSTHPFLSCGQSLGPDLAQGA